MAGIIFLLASAILDSGFYRIGSVMLLYLPPKANWFSPILFLGGTVLCCPRVLEEVPSPLVLQAPHLGRSWPWRSPVTPTCPAPPSSQDSSTGLPFNPVNNNVCLSLKTPHRSFPLETMLQVLLKNVKLLPPGNNWSGLTKKKEVPQLRSGGSPALSAPEHRDSLAASSQRLQARLLDCARSKEARSAL